MIFPTPSGEGVGEGLKVSTRLLSESFRFREAQPTETEKPNLDLILRKASLPHPALSQR